MSSPARSLTWLHISDLHFGHGDANYRFDQEGVTGAVLDHARERASKLGPPDLILLTGDVAFSGQAAQYVQAREWLRRLVEAVGGQPRVFVVPGNHDIDRGRARGFASAAVHRELRAAPKKLDELLGNPDDLRTIWPKVAGYADFAKEVGESGLTPERPFYAHEVPCALGGKLVVVGLNTALLSVDGEDGPTNLALGRGQLLKAIEQQPKDALLLVLQHHPASWLVDGKDLSAQLQQRAHIQFSGHVHEQRSDAHAPLLGGSRLHFAAGAGHKDHSEDGQHAYTWGQLTAEGLAYYSCLWLPERKGFSLAQMLDTDDFKRDDHAFVERARLPRSLQNWLPQLEPGPNSGASTNAAPVTTAALRSKLDASRGTPAQAPHDGPFTRSQVYEALTYLTSPMLNDVVFQSGVPTHFFPGPSAGLAELAMAFVNYCEKFTDDGLETIVRILRKRYPMALSRVRKPR